MTRIPATLKVVAALAAVVVIGLFIGWLGTRGNRPKTVDLDHPQPATSHVASAAAQAKGPTTFVPPPRSPATNTQRVAQVSPPNLITNWEDRIDEILTADTEDPDKTKQMMQLFPQLPEDAQVEVAQHLTNLTADDTYAQLASYLTNSALAEPVLDVLLSDLLNRPNSTKLPLLLDVARDPQNPKAAEAKDLMELLLEQDYGENWQQWQTAMQQWLKDNPD